MILLYEHQTGNIVYGVAIQSRKVTRVRENIFPVYTRTYVYSRKHKSRGKKHVPTTYAWYGTKMNAAFPLLFCCETRA